MNKPEDQIMTANRKKFGPISAFGPAVILVLFVVAGFAQAATWNVPGDSATIQGGIDLASYGDTVQVAAGTYVENITLKNGVALIGAGQDTTTIDGNLAGSVVTSSSCGPTTVLDGFTITNGISVVGGGMYNNHGSPTVANCIFYENFVFDGGGGMYNDSSDPTVMGCTFIGNLGIVGGLGGGMFNYNLSSPTVTNCTFTGNSAQYGGGMQNQDWSNPTVTNCTFSGNTSGMDNGEYCHPIVTNCTFSRNNYDGMFNSDYSYPAVTNCIFWGNGDDHFEFAPVRYSNVQGGRYGTGNIDANPLFVDADGPDDIAGTEDDDLRLLPGSPCIDAGDSNSVPWWITDMEGNPRFLDDPYMPDTGHGTYPIVDMGAYEYIPPVIFVDESASGRNDGITWTDAYNYMQDGLADADFGDTIVVAEGTYRPDEDTNDPCGTGDRGARFLLTSGVAIYGGFPTGGGDFIDRDPDLYETILSGDLLEDDGPDFANNDENSYHVVRAGCDPNAILDGFTISGGNADGIDEFGGGMYISKSDPTIANCTFKGNSAIEFGGGMFNDISSPVVIHCNFIENSADFGSGLCNNGGSPAIINCYFFANSANDSGGGIFNKYSESVLINCVLSGNTAHNGTGGGIYNNGVDPAILNCSFSNNMAHDGGGMYNYYSDPIITNCVMWGDTASTGDEIWNDSSNPVISYSDIAGCGGSGAWDSSFGTDGGGNIDDDPMFKDADGPDDVSGTMDDNLQLAHESPCIDAADSNSVPADYGDLDEDGNTAEQTPLDLAGRSRFTDDPVMADTGAGTPPIVDMGAYERYEFCGSAEFPYPVMDGNHDCHVNLADLAIMVTEWLIYTGPE